MVTFKRTNFKFDDDKMLEIVSTNVRKYRKEAGITQEQLAVDISMSPDYLRRFESQKGREGLTVRKLYKMSVVLNVPIDKFFEDKELHEKTEV